MPERHPYPDYKLKMNHITKNVGIRICPPADEVLGDLACWQTE